ncbi:ABC transporter substrate-binding protein [Paenibacillus sp. PL91]|uniref:ABC transporter substrate-binding protein n=1 Tax=Paenibacillus sp. PL91 TaxID=2729538 RepID=UPI00145DE7C3|nr:ABC transporter substrate-binding protein [Paenibacillus sp. PL91]MBC9198780.1 ABC transporter substrate-binding protein [Paenibacillus sp. PL91]
MRYDRSRLLFAVVFAMALLLEGCSSETTLQQPLPNKTVIEQAQQANDIYPPARPILMGFSQLGSESDWRRANTASIIDSAEEAGIELLFENAEQSQEKQVEALRSFIDKQVDVIALAPVVHSGWEVVLKEAKDAGIPVIISDRSVDVSDSSLFVTHIGSDFYEEGRKAGKYLLDKMSNEAGKVEIVELRGTEGSSPSIQRGQGFEDTLKDNERFHMLRSESANFTFEQGKETMRVFLREHGDDIRVLFSHNDDMALGAIEAIEEFGLKPGVDIFIISVDGTRKAFEKLAEGKINCVVECNPLLGPNIMQAVQELIAGRTLPKRIFPSESVFTQQTAEREVDQRKY